MQEITKHDPDNGVYGDCFRACVASLLEMELSDVPHFCSREDWVGAFHDWLEASGLFAVEVSLKHEQSVCPSPKQHCIVSGMGPRGVMHSVVALFHGVGGPDGFELVHDPYPGGIFIEDGEWAMFIGRKVVK